MRSSTTGDAGAGGGADGVPPSRTGMRDWSADLTGFHQRLGERLAARGYRYPGVAAAALAARGSRGVDRRSFADQLGLPRRVLEAAESGQLSGDDLPRALLRSMPATAGVDPLGREADTPPPPTDDGIPPRR